MALNIKSEEADRLARAFADVTGESLTTAVTNALEERRARVTRRQNRASGIEIDASLARARRAPSPDDRTDDEIVGYNELGSFD